MLKGLIKNCYRLDSNISSLQIYWWPWTWIPSRPPVLLWKIVLSPVYWAVKFPFPRSGFLANWKKLDPKLTQMDRLTDGRMYAGSYQQHKFSLSWELKFWAKNECSLEGTPPSYALIVSNNENTVKRIVVFIITIMH